MLLAYFMRLVRPEDAHEDTQSGTGLNNTSLHRLISGDLVCVYSEASEDLLQAAPDLLRKRALEFHKIVQSEFTDQTILPFRFPSLFPNAEAIRRFLDTYSPAYVAELHRLQGLVQAELHIPRPAPAGPSSGAEYLRSRRAWTEQIAYLRDRLQKFPDVREIQHSELVREDRIFVLLPRASMGWLKSEVTSWSDLPRLRFSGPWPPLAFVKYQPRLEGVAENK
jgi:hypothetical protein